MPSFGIQIPKKYTFFLYSFLIFFFSLNKIQAQEHHSRKEVLTALNSYIDFISNYAYKTRFLHRSHYNYYNNLVRSYKNQRNIPNFSFSPSKNPAKDSIAYQIAKANSKYIPSQFRTQINSLADSLRSIQQEQLRIAKNLKKLTHTSLKDSISYRKGFFWMKNLYDYAESYRNLSNQFYVLSKEIDSKYPATNTNWIAAGAFMQEAIDTSRSYLQRVQESLVNKTPIPNSEYLETLLQQMKKERNNVLNELKEYGSYNGKDPHSKYDYLISDLSMFIEKLNSDYDINNTRNNLFNELLYHFNWAIVRYNNFAVLSGENGQNIPPAYLLKQPIETLFYVYKPIE